MKVARLIEELQKYDGEIEVYYNCDGCQMVATEVAFEDELDDLFNPTVNKILEIH